MIPPPVPQAPQGEGAVAATPFFSVIIPAYNAAGFLVRTLDSVAAQTSDDHEILITNDGSTDRTQEYIENWNREHPSARLRVVYQQNMGQGRARNTAIRLARGEFLAFLDADDTWLPPKLARVKRHLDMAPDVDVLCHDQMIIEAGRRPQMRRYGPSTTFEELLFGGSTLSPSATVARRCKVIEVGMFSEDRELDGVEDADLWVRLARVSKIDYLHEVLGTYSVHAGNMSGDAGKYVPAVLSVLQRNLATSGVTFPQWKIQKRFALSYFNAARIAQRRGHARESARWYLKSIRAFPLFWKSYAGISLLAAGWRR